MTNRERQRRLDQLARAAQACNTADARLADAILYMLSPDTEGTVHFTQADVAACLGISRQAVNQWVKRHG